MPRRPGGDHREQRSEVACAARSPVKITCAGVLVCLSALHAGVRHLPARLQADVRRPRVHAAAGPAADRSLHAGELAGPLRRREHRAGDAGRFRLGRRRAGQRHARAGARRSTTSRARAHAAGKVVVLGGPSVSASPEMYPDYRLPAYRRTGRRDRPAHRAARRERGAARRADAASRPRSACRWPISRSRPTTSIPLGRYLLGSLQFSSGCPYRCEFCDIPALYGRQPRLKTPAADHRRARCHAWRSRAPADGLLRRRQFHRQPQGRARRCCRIWSRGRSARLSAAVRLRGDAQHRQADRDPGADAGGRVRRPSSSASRRRRPTRSTPCARTTTPRVPMMESIKTLNRYGIEVTSGIILGLDTDTGRHRAAAQGLHRASRISRC